jgi:hypothetical protein
MSAQIISSGPRTGFAERHQRRWPSDRNQAGGTFSILSGTTTRGGITFSGISASLRTQELSLSDTVMSGFVSGHSIIVNLSGTSPTGYLGSGNVLYVSNTTGSASFDSENFFGTVFSTSSIGDETTVTLCPTTDSTASSVTGNA